MTYKTIITNIIERNARQQLTNEINKESEIHLDFGAVEFTNHDTDTQSFIALYKEIGKPWSYQVLGYISENGYISLCGYRVEGSKKIDWIKFTK